MNRRLSTGFRALCVGICLLGAGFSAAGDFRHAAVAAFAVGLLILRVLVAISEVKP